MIKTDIFNFHQLKTSFHYANSKKKSIFALSNKHKTSKKMKRIAIFASGSGTNFQQICEYFNKNKHATVEVLIVNKKNAYVRERAKNLGVEDYYFTREDFYNSNKIVDLLQSKGIDMVVLAGFLWLVPANIIAAFPNKIVNIHPALLPNYGGKGMYGHHVHEAVIAAREPKSGITIHYVNEIYDSGDIIFQAECQLTEQDTVETLEEKIHLLEKEHFPKVIDSIL